MNEVDNSMTLDNLISNAASVVISGHIKPDGDCVGSVLALYNYIKLNYPEKRADVYLEKPAEKFAYLQSFDCIRTVCEEDRTYDLFVSLDCSTLERLGDAAKYFRTAAHTVCLDHHVSNPGYADENYIYGSSSSACEVLFGFLDQGKMNADVAACLYTGIVTDTGVFKYSCTSPDTMRVVACLMEFGIPVEDITNECFFAKSFAESRILGHALDCCRRAFEGRVVYCILSIKEMDEYGVGSKELDGVVEQMKLVRGCSCSLLLYQTDAYEYKVSLRSNDPVNVNAVASVFGGGGHVCAAGCTVCGEAEDILEELLDRIGTQIN